MGRTTGYAGLHDYNRAIRDIAASEDWQSGVLVRQMGRVANVAARYMGVGRVGLWSMKPDSQALDCLCQFDSRYGLVDPLPPIRRDRYPGYFEALAGSRVVAVSDALHHPAMADRVESHFKPEKISSLLDAPIWLDGKLVGVVSHEHSGDQREWRDEDIAFAGSMADFAAMALSQDRYQRVEAARGRLARIIEATPDMVAILAADGRPIQVNPAGRRILGLDDEADVSQCRGHDFMGADAAYLVETEILPALLGAGRWSGEALLREGTPQAMPVSVVALAHRDAGGRLEYFSVTLRDLTVQKTIQRQIEALNDELEARVMARTRELEHANRNLETFAYSVSHDLKAPLRGITGYSHLLVSEFRDALPGEAREYLDLIEASSRRMDRLIEDVLAYSRAQLRPLKPMRTDVRDLVQRVVDEFGHQLAGRVELSLDLEPYELECDREGVDQILRNYLSNALKFSGKRQTPTISIEGRVRKDGYRFTVRDNGVGFDMSYHDRIFEIFHRLDHDADQDGTGIGLALVARAAPRLGGRAWAHGEPGKGASFFFELEGGKHA